MIGPDGCRGRSDGCSVAAWIASAPGHHVDDDFADPAASATADPDISRKDQRGDDVDVAETATKSADQRDTELQQPVADGAGVHDVGGNDEERHRQQDKALVESRPYRILPATTNGLSTRGKIDKGGEQNRVGNGRTDPRRVRKVISGTG